MSDEGDVDVESAEDVPDIGVEATATTVNDGLYPGGTHDKRAHHNALERRRRDHIKDSFHSLRDCIPSLVGEKVSRAHILNKATEYIRYMQKGGSIREEDICDLARRNEVMEEQVRALEEAKVTGKPCNTEDILQNVALRVKTRQAQEIQQQQQNKNNANKKQQQQQTVNKASPKVPSAASANLAAGGVERAVQKSSSSTPKNTDTAPPTTTTSSSSPQLLPSNLNLLAGSIKNTQSLLSVLQKNLNPNSSLPSNIKSLAARVLASPLVRGAQKTSQASSLPRGIVTATTVPKGSNLSTQQSTVPSLSTTNIMTTTTSSPLSSTSLFSSSTSQQTTTGSGNHDNDSTNSNPPTAESALPTIPPVAAATVATNASSEDMSKEPETVAAVSSRPAPSSDESGLGHTSSSSLLNSQFLEAHNLLQQQGTSVLNNAGSADIGAPTTTGLQGGVVNELGAGQPLSNSNSSVIPSAISLAAQGLNISPELLAQVSSFLNLPNIPPSADVSSLSALVPPPPPAAAAAATTGGDLTTLLQDSIPSQATPTAMPSPSTAPGGLKRAGPGTSEADISAAKKPHLE